MRFPARFADLRLAVLVRRARRGDQRAFRSLYRALYPLVTAYVGRRVRELADAEDVVARTFGKLVESLHDVDPARGGPRAFVIAVARNLIIDDHRARRATMPIDSLAGCLADESEDALGRMVRRERYRAVSGALRLLPAEARELIALRYGDGLRHAEIARLRDTSEEAVRKRLSRLRRELRAMLEAGADSEGLHEVAQSNG